MLQHPQSTPGGVFNLLIQKSLWTKFTPRYPYRTIICIITQFLFRSINNSALVIGADVNSTLVVRDIFVRETESTGITLTTVSSDSLADNKDDDSAPLQLPSDPATIIPELPLV
jgi:hypothetical protein